MRKASSSSLLRLLLICGVAVYCLLFSALSIARYNTFHATTLDLGIMTQVTWNTAHGRWFETSIGRAANIDLIGSYLGNHVRPVLLLLAPLYRLWPDARLLLILQTLALGAAAFPLYAIARRRIKHPTAAFLVVVCYLLYPALGFLNLVDFHPIAFSIPLLFAAYWALAQERWLLFWGAVVLALGTKEELVVPIAAWGGVNLLRPGKRRLGAALVAVALVWAGVCFGLIIPTYNEGQAYRFFDLWAHLPGISASPGAGGTTQPLGGGSVETVALFLVHLFLPLGILPFFGPAALVVALPSLLYLLLGQRPAFHSVGYQYPAVLIPWLFLAVVEGLQRLRRRGHGRTSRMYRLALAFMVFGTLGIQVPLNPIFLYAQAGKFQPEPTHSQVEEALALIPPDAGVAAVSRFGPHLVNRRLFVPLEYPPPFRLDHVTQADYVLLDLVDCRLVSDSDPRAAYADMVAQIVRTRSYRVRYWDGRILLLERGTPSPEEMRDVSAYLSRLVEQNQPCWP